MAEQAASTVQYVITYTNAPYTYDRSDTLVVNTEEGMEDGKKVRSVKTPIDGVEAQRARYASGLHLADDDAAWTARQSATASKEVSKKMDKKPAAPKCKNDGCTYKDKNMRLVDGRCKMCAAWFRKHGTERKTGLKNDVEKQAETTPMVETAIVTETAETVAVVDVAVTDEVMAETATASETAENVAVVDVPAVDTPMVSAVDAIDAMMADAMDKTAIAVSTCSDREKAAKAAMAAAREMLAAVKEDKKREKEARLARQAEEAERKKNVVNPLDALKAALMAGGDDAVAAFDAAMANGILVAKGIKKARAPKLNADGTPMEKKAASARTSGRILTNEEIADIHARIANGEKPVDIGRIHGLHHVTVTSVAKGLIKSK